MVGKSWQVKNVEFAVTHPLWIGALGIKTWVKHHHDVIHGVLETLRKLRCCRDRLQMAERGQSGLHVHGVRYFLLKGK